MTTSSRGMGEMGWAGNGGPAPLRGQGLRAAPAAESDRAAAGADRGAWTPGREGVGAVWGALRRMASAPGGALLVTVGAAHLLLAALLATWMLAPAEQLLGVHPALKPLKFAVSIAMYVLTMAWVLPRLTLTERTRLRVTRLMAGTMVIEMVAILTQALRRVPSHFNVTSALNGAIWNVMGAAITVASGVMVYLAWTAARRPLTEQGGAPTSPSLAYALRGALILVGTSAVSGFTMAKMMRHSVGGTDGGPGMPLTNWSTAIGDVRVAHFFQLHALQLLPLALVVISLVTTKESTRFGLVRAVVWLYAAFCVGTFAQALYGLPLLG